MAVIERAKATQGFAGGPAGRLAYDDVGSGEPAVVLVHGGFGNRAHFSHITAHLAANRRVIAVDLRGHGDSDVPDGEFTVADLAADVGAVCDTAGVARAVICGHSLSGGVALELAVARPELASAVAILDGSIVFPEDVVQALRTHLLPALEGPGWREALRGLVTSKMLTAYDPPEVRDRVLQAVDKAPRRVAVPWFCNAYTWDASERIAAFRHPLLFVHATSPVDIGRLQQLRPGVLVGQVVGSGHFVTLTVPQQVNAMLDRFLEICAGSQARTAVEGETMNQLPKTRP